ncbi:MAG TPA: sulfatase-like hydrolase/transferase [Chitinophagaceae bacterium]|nr:sulfatase-like hydrolase/transferase [Chitinophagaceae bacterium]
MLRKPFFSKPWYLLLLPVFFVLHGFEENFYLIPVKDSLILLFIYTGCSIILAILFLWYFKNITRAAFFSFLLMGFNFFFGYLHDGLKSFFPDSFVVKYSVVLSVAFLFFLAFAFLMKKKKFALKKMAVYLNLVLGVFIVIDIALVVKKSVSRSGEDRKSALEDFNLPLSHKNLPDVYLIIADEYAGSKDLSDICGFDNTPFLDSLRKKGFFIANNSRSNYNYTVYSMASVLNMDYLVLNSEQMKKGDHKYALKKIFDNRVVSFFKQAGYEFYNYSSFDMSGQPAGNNNSFIPARTTLFTSQTLVNRFKRDVWMNLARMLNLQGILKKSLFQNLRFNEQVYKETVNIAHSSNKRHKFVYTHLELPHYPYYNDDNGDIYPYKKIMNDAPGNTKHYVLYLQYANRQLLKLVDEILQNNSALPVIILMSDHGYRCYPNGKESYAFVNLSSVYLPDKNYSLFSDSLNNVNVFRTLLNSEFNQHLPLLKDTSITISVY